MFDNKNNPKSNQERIDDFDYLANAVSVTECTGLIPSLPTSENELESYEELYHYHPSQEQVTKASKDEKNTIGEPQKPGNL